MIIKEFFVSEVDFFLNFRLSGKPHVVYSGVALKMGEKIIKFTESTKVYIGDMSDEEIKAYVETGEPMWVLDYFL